MSPSLFKNAVASITGGEGKTANSFGITPIKPAHNPYSKDKNSTLKCVLINSPEANAIVFRVEPTDPDARGSWAEKIVFDAIYKGEKWVRDLGIDSKNQKWFHENEVVNNEKGYPIRMFVLRCEEMPPKEKIFDLGEHICIQINSAPGNRTTTSVERDAFFWIDPDTKPVWSDIVGVDVAMETLMIKTGVPNADDYFKQNKDIIHSFFHPGSLSLQLARVLKAPMEEVHPDFLEDVKPSNGDLEVESSSDEEGSGEEAEEGGSAN